MNVEENDLKTTPYKKEEAEPNLRAKEFAFMKFMNALNTLDYTVRDLLQEFESTTNGFLLADSSLL